MTTVRNFVNGAHRDAADGQTTDLVDPTTGQVYGTAPLSGKQDVAAATAAAAAAFGAGRDTT
ncbi:MAG: Gamma-aminobutyraldehyde dehydrogenase, partial [Frankiales bacterium]|nr:Gamma-aminobutyraldehyde dehydrogenase [Frankiales bacterium]